MKGKECSTCNHLNPIEAIYCEVCGDPFSEDFSSDSAEGPLDIIICPKCQTINSKTSNYCTRCGTSLIQSALTNDGMDGRNPKTIFGIQGISNNPVFVLNTTCYQCDQKKVSVCKKDHRLFCSNHGRMGYCDDCIYAARSNVPTAIKMISWTIYFFAGLMIIFDIYLFLQIGKFFTDPYITLGIFRILPFLDPLESLIRSLVPYVAILVFIFLCVPALMIVLAQSLNLGDTAAEWILIIGSSILIVFCVDRRILLGVIFPALFLFLVFRDRHWFEIKRIKE